MKNTIHIFVLFLIFQSPIKTYAWGKDGHDMVAEIAYKNLNRKTKKNILKILDGMSVEQAANWMDDMRKNQEYNYMKPYHYVNFDKETAVTMIENDNVIYIIDKTINELKHKEKLSDADIKLKVLMLFHLIGDIHMPLHVGYGNDKGGNSVQVNYLGKGTNLHGLWDFGIIEAKKINLKQCKNANKFTKKQIDSIQSSRVLDWAKESRSYLPVIYDTNGTIISEEYATKHQQLIKTRIQVAGIRLAGVLNQLFKD
jgi:S1/P1 Nuclease